MAVTVYSLLSLGFVTLSGMTTAPSVLASIDRLVVYFPVPAPTSHVLSPVMQYVISTLPLFDLNVSPTAAHIAADGSNVDKSIISFLLIISM